MKFLAIIGDEETRPQVRKLFMSHGVHMFSNVAIRGCSCDAVKQPPAWWPGDQNMSTYSSLCFAILDDGKAEVIMDELRKNPIATDPAFPSRAFVMSVDQML
ncbi:MAG: hypothetical protein HGB01_01695 [Chlorobiaceae bacterium]|nr:hypothetical protein [Chlorobiales bacterium]NTU90909.1 hypothetical protein [Chlorobiaceae bacterium]NTV24905.1 hypothetical protein [Chlorobiaceae bacterium]